MKRLLLGVLLVAGCSTPLTSDRVGPSFSEAFSGLYAKQQAVLGRDVDPSDLGAAATCRRSGTDESGPGEDWQCSVQYADNGTAGAQVYEVQVKPDGCWKAQGPPGVQPALVTDPVSGRTSTNPLAEFDGCFDTSWR